MRKGMQLYQPYEQKMQKLADIKAKILRYKYLILACLLIILAGISTLLYFKGTIREDIVLKTQYEYGENISCESKAFMAKTKIVFYQNGKEVKGPIRPGEYTARVVARGAFGIKKYGATHKFIIVPKIAEVSLSSQSCTYGETPTIRVDGLIVGDSVDTQRLNFIYYDVLGDEPMVQIEEGSFAVYNKQWIDVTDCYDFQNSVYDKKSITWTKRYITVKTGGMTHVYNGDEISCPQYEIAQGSLASGDTLQSSEFPSLQNVGKVKNEVQFTITNSDGVNVGKMYKITEIFGSIEVMPRPFTITTEDREKVADGEPFDKPTFKVSGLLDEHEVKVSSYCKESQPGHYENYLVYDIQDIGGVSVKNNYKPTESWGKLTIYLGKIVICVSGSRTYDGKQVTQFSAQCVEGALLSGESIVVTKAQVYDSSMQPTTVKNAGTYKVEILEYKIEGRDKNAPDYLVEVVSGEYTVTKRDIEVRLLDAKKSYDRKPLTSKDCESDNLVSGHRVEVTAEGSITEPGTSTNVLKEVEIYDKSNNLVTDNYNIIKYDGKLMVKKREITVTPLSIVKTYDGQSAAYPALLSKEQKIIVTWTIMGESGEPLLSGDYIDYTNIVIGNDVNVGEKSIVLQGACVKYSNGTKDNGKYYDITVQSSIATINPMQIEILSLSHEKVYDGQPLVGKTEDCYINKGVLANGDTIIYTVSATQTEVGSCKNLVVEVVIMRGATKVGYVRCDSAGKIIEGNDSYYNYQITIEHGTLTVNK